VDSTVRVWSTTKQHPLLVIKAHEAAITGLDVHATGDYIMAASMDTTWSFTDLHTGAVLAKVVIEY